MSEVLDCIMCIDDDEATNFYNKSIIMKIDVIKNHLIYEDAEKAIEYLSHPVDSIKVPDLILLDINMPRVNGWDFLDRYIINGFDKKFDQTKIIVLTTSSNPSDILRADSYFCVTGLENKILNATKIKNILTNHFGISFENVH